MSCDLNVGLMVGRSLPSTTASPVMPSRPINPTSIGLLSAPFATTEANPLSGK